MQKSILRYPGGKNRAVKIICSLIPKDCTEICSPFLGGGSIEIACANNNVKVYAYDVFEPLVEFWKCLLRDPHKLSELVKGFHPLPKSTFYELQKTYSNYTSKYLRAAIFYVLNRSSFSGTTLSGGMSPGHERFNQPSIERLANFQLNNFNVELADFNESIKLHENKLLYLDPPYLIKHKIYGEKGNTHNGFDHDGLSKLIKKRNNWILSYNDSEEIQIMYGDYYFYYPDWKYGMSQNKKSREVLILSNDIAKKNGFL